MIRSSRVAKNFSRGSAAYEQKADFQRNASTQLAALVQKFACSIQIKRIWEIGCGTGFLTKQLFTLFPHADFIITDISAAMLTQCQRYTAAIRQQHRISVEFRAEDVLTTFPAGHFDLIVSALTFQWVPDLGVLIAKLHDALHRDGALFFSTLGEQTYSQLRAQFQKHELPYPGPTFLHEAALRQACACFPLHHWEQEWVTEIFPSLHAFLKHIRETGVGNAGETLRPGKLRQLLRAHPTAFLAEYQLWLACLRK